MLILALFVIFIAIPALAAYGLVWYISYVAHKPDFEMPKEYVLYDEDFGIDISEDYYREHREV